MKKRLNNSRSKRKNRFRRRKCNTRPARGIAWIPAVSAVLLTATASAGFYSIYSRAAEAFACTTPEEKKAMSRIDTEDSDQSSEDYMISDYSAYGEIRTSDGKIVYSPNLTSAGRAYYNLLGTIATNSDFYVAYACQDELYKEYDLLNGLGTGDKTLQLTLNSHLQETMTDYLEANNVNGSVICEYLNSGEICCMVSTPAAEDQTDLDREGALLNLNEYTTVPGSTMKIITSLLLELEGIDIDTLSFDCTGSFTLPDGNEITCEKEHGSSIGIVDALGDSCNVWFAQAISLLDWDSVKEDLALLGFSVNPEAGTKDRLGNVAYRSSQTIVSGKTDFNSVYGLIGQGETLVNPIEMMYLASEIACEGNAQAPFLVQGQSGITPLSLTEDQKNCFAKVRKIWEKAYETYYAFATELYSDKLVAAKTGTAQIGGDAEKKLLIGYTDQYAFYIVINNYITVDGKKLGILPADIARVLLDAAT